MRVLVAAFPLSGMLPGNLRLELLPCLIDRLELLPVRIGCVEMLSPTPRLGAHPSLLMRTALP